MYIYEIFSPLLTVIFAFAFVFKLGEFRVSRKAALITMSVSAYIVAVVNCWIYDVHGEVAYIRLFIFTLFVPLFLTLFIISQRHDLRDLFTVFTAVFIIILIGLPVSMLAEALGARAWFIFVVKIFVGFIIFVFMNQSFVGGYKQLQDEVDSGWLMFCLLPGIGCAVVYVMMLLYSYNNDIDSVSMVLILTVCLLSLVYMILNYIFRLLRNKHESEEREKLLSQQNKYWEAQLELQNASLEQAKMYRHDIRHHIAVATELIRSGDTLQAESYLRDYSSAIDSIKPVFYCENMVVNTLLTVYCDKARKSGINITVNTIIPEESTVDRIDLAAIFANIIENAIEGSLRDGSDAEKFITLDTNYDLGKLMIRCRNNCDSDIEFSDDMPLSRKPGGGTGTRSIAHTLKKYHGMVEFSSKDGVFTVKAVFRF